jgi:cell division protein FtsQ
MVDSILSRPRLVLVIVGGLVLTLSGGWTWHSGAAATVAEQMQSGLDQAARSGGLRLDSVVVSGRRETPRSDLLTATGMARGDSILAIDPDAIRLQVEALPWVASAATTRRLPDTVFITIAERRPVAFWQSSNDLVLVDATGAHIEAIPANQAVPRRFVHLPVIAGNGALNRIGELLILIAAAPAIADRVTGAVRVSDRRWNLRLTNGVRLLLPEVDGAAALAHLTQIDGAHDLLSRDVSSIDLRLPDRIIIQLHGDPARRIVRVGETT